MRRLSYWEHQSLLPAADIVVIGAGIVGMTAARLIAMEHPHLTVSLLEKDIIGSVASSRNAGFACWGSVSEILADLRQMDAQSVADIIRARKEGLELLIERYGKRALAFNICGGYELFESKPSFEKCANHLHEINELISSSQNTFEIVDTPPSMQVHHRCILNSLEGHLDTGKLYNCLISDCLSSGVKIYRGMEVVDIRESPNEVTLDLKDIGEIKAARVVIATNALTPRLLPPVPVEPARNQVIVTQPIPHHGLYGTYHMDEGYIYIRDIGARILIGGARNRYEQEHTDTHGINDANVDFLLSLLRDKILPQQPHHIEAEYKWSGIIATGPSKRPIVKKLSDRITIGVRLGGMGVAIGMKIGRTVATLCLS